MRCTELLLKKVFLKCNVDTSNSVSHLAHQLKFKFLDFPQKKYNMGLYCHVILHLVEQLTAIVHLALVSLKQSQLLFRFGAL